MTDASFFKENKMADKVIKNFNGTHEELMELLKGSKDQVSEDLDLNSMKVTELRALAKERGLQGYSGLNKAALINLIDISSESA